MLKRFPAFVVLAALLSIPTPALADDRAPDQSQSERERELARERAERERERQREQAEQQRERAEAQRERQREQAEAQRERQRDQAERDRERQQDERERQQERAERDRERREEQAERDRHRQEARKRQGRWVVVEGERTTQSFKVGDGGSLRVDNLAGDVVVTGTSGGDIQVQAVRHARGTSDADARQRLKDVDISIQKVGSRVEIETTHGRNARAWVEYTISVPAGTSVDLKSVSGELRISNVRGEVRAESVSGDVEANSLARVAMLKSVSGDVVATMIGSDIELALESVSGDVVAKSIKSRNATVGTVSGSVQLSGCACAQASVQSVSGSVEYSGRLEKTGRYELKTHSGNVVLSAGGDGFNLDASTFSGTLRSDVPLVTRGGNADFQRGRGPDRWVKAVAGGGGAYVKINTFSGDIVVTKGQ